MKVKYKYGVVNQSGEAEGANTTATVLGWFKTRKEAVDSVPTYIRGGYKNVFLVEAVVAFKLKSEPVYEEGIE